MNNFVSFLDLNAVFANSTPGWLCHTMQVERVGTNLEVGCTHESEWGRKETYLASVCTWSTGHDLEQMGNL